MVREPDVTPDRAIAHTSGEWRRFAGRVVACHTATYLVAGFVSMHLFDYAALWQTPGFANYRPLDSAWVAAGPSLQVVRGLVLAVVLWPFRTVFLDGVAIDRPRGWLSLWGLLVGVGILSTYGPAPGSLEGLIYLRTPALHQLTGLPEILAQSLAFSVCLVAWSRRPHPAYRVVLGGLTMLAVMASTAGILFGG